MKTFKQLMTEVAEPKSADERNFKDKHEIEVTDHPVSKESQHTSSNRKAVRKADYMPGEDEDVYEAKLDPVNKKAATKDFDNRKDKDIDNDGDVDDSDEYLHKRRKAISKAMKKENVRWLDEKASSKAQQKLMGMALAYKNGDLEDASDEVKELADSMSKKDLEDYAKTKHKWLPDKVDEAVEDPSKLKSGSRIVYDDKLHTIKSKPKHVSGDTWEVKASKEGGSIVNLRLTADNFQMDESTSVYPKGSKSATSYDSYEDYVAAKKKQGMQVLPKALWTNLKKDSKTESAFVAKAAYAKKNNKKKFELGDEEYPVTIKDKNAEKIVNEAKKIIKDLGSNTKIVRDKDGSLSIHYKDKNIGDQQILLTPRQVKELHGLLMNEDLGHLMNKYSQLEEAFKKGSMELDDGSTVELSKQDADLLNQMFDDLNPTNRKKMKKVAMKDEDGFEEILGFAREAL